MAVDSQNPTPYAGAPMGAPVFRYDLEEKAWRATFACGCDVLSWETHEGAPPRLVACVKHADAAGPVVLARCLVHGSALTCTRCQGARGGRVLSDAKRAQLAAAARRPRPSRRKEPSTTPAPRKAKGKASSRKTKGHEDGYR